MTLLGEDHSFVRRALVGVRAALAPKVAPGRGDRPLTLVGHRGSICAAPENTVVACQWAIEAGAGGVEVDVCVTRDDHVVLWHDRDPSLPVARARRRGIDGSPFVPFVPSGRLRPITELSFDEVYADYGYARLELPLLGGQRERVAPVDHFDDLCTWLAAEPRAQALMLDVKLGPTELARVPALVSALARALEQYPELERRSLYVMSHEREVFQALRREMRRRALGSWIEIADFELPGVVQVARRIDAHHVAIGFTVRRAWPAVRNEVVDAVRARRRGELGSVTVWTLHDQDQLRDIVQIGVDNVIVGDELLGQSAVTST